MAPTDSRVIGFAHRGAALIQSEENTLPAFERALALGADGLESDVWLTADEAPVLLHPRFSLRRPPPVSRLRRCELPASIPSLADLYDRCGSIFELSLDMAEPRAAEAVVRAAEDRDALDRLWLTYWKLPTLEAWRLRWPDVRLVYPTLPLYRGRFARLLERLAAMGVDAVNVPHRFCAERLVELAHHHHLRIFAWGTDNRRQVERVVAHGIDGVYCDDVAAMVAAIGDLRRATDS